MALAERIGDRNFPERNDLPDIPAGLDQPPTPKPGDRDYVHSVFFDESRFRTEAARAELLLYVCELFPDQWLWELVPATVESLHGRVHIFSAKHHTTRFQIHGYVAEIDRAPFGIGRPTRSVHAKRAWDAFLGNFIIAEAIVGACRQLPNIQQRNTIFRDSLISAIVPMLGKLDGEDDSPGTNMLADYHGLLVAPRRFEHDRVVYPADAVTLNSADTDGREVFRTWCLHGGDEFKGRVKFEVEAWSNALGEAFSADGLVLWIAQTLAVLRVQATESSFREWPGYVKSGTREFTNRRRVAATKEIYTKQRFDVIVDGVREPHCRFVPPTVRRAPISAKSNVVSVLAGGVGLDDEAIWRDQDVLKQGWSLELLGSVAAWVNQLKSRHYAVLDLPMARLIQEILTDDLIDLDDLRDADGRAALRLIRAQFPDAIWQEMLDIAIGCAADVDTIDVQYRWNDNPVDPLRIERDGTAIVIVGPLLDLRAQGHDVWKEHAERFRGRGTLTI